MVDANKVLRLGLMGTGVAARELHWPALAALQGEVELVALCNRTLAKAEDFARLAGERAGQIACYDDWDAFLAHPGLDAVLIALPATQNLTACRAVLAAGKHVLVEKPLAATPEDAGRLLALAADYPAQVSMVAENLRYSAALLQIRDWLASGVAGQPYALHWTATNEMRSDNRYLASGWRTDADFPGGLLLDVGVHYAAAVELLLGRISSARLLTSRTSTHLGAFDGGSLQFSTASGAHGTLNLYFSAIGREGFKLLLLAEHGSAEFDGRTVTLIGPDGMRHVQAVSGDFGYTAELRAFASAVLRGEPNASSFAQAWQDMQVWTATLARPGELVLF
ncbi:Predicted dehydrogenase [Andreprevotia lacus DSM 23236]|jgi:predicted dehydrogenase|uniref:Predicted dehydrogenase n=1 Tax=Andreprevotia lacus DSM 23236 TaxID=1121001 RepID=A0A1W1X994_9NEIS|nr:Gfo/Idh/MocA family oxidoreductase [Andreprevotia lacus]SMC20575.1 Predicted dehydrogenase [Andreprevotia lacus DSM 23236]